MVRIMGIPELLAAGLVTVVNGAWTIVDTAVHPLTGVLLLLGGAFTWLALLETDELARQGTKPEVRRGL